jgi:hypothetical protein
MPSTVCVLMSFRLPCSVNELLHSSQVNRCSPLCVCWCAFRLPWCVKDLLHTSHINRCSPLCVLMCLQITLLCERLITHITSKQMLSTVCLLMCLQITVLCEWLITHIGAIYLPLSRTITLLLKCCTKYMTWTWTIHIIYGFLFLRSSLLRDQRELY